MSEKKVGVLAAILGSVCCLGPLLLVALGVSAAGVGTFFGKYHWAFQVPALLLLAFAWSRYFQAKRACATESCKAPKKSTFFTLLLATLFVGFFVSNQALLALKKESAAELSPPSTLHQGTLVAATLPVDGMTCSTCELTIQRKVGALQGVSSVKASAVSSSVTVRYDPKKVSLRQIGRAIEKAGYKVKSL